DSQCGVCRNDGDGNQGRASEVCTRRMCDLRPAVASEVAKAEKHRTPEDATGIRIRDEHPVAETTRSGCDCRDVPHAWDEVAEREQPAAKSLKPVLRALDRVVMASESCAQQRQTYPSADRIT